MRFTPLKVFSLTFSISFLMFIALAFFVRSIGVIFGSAFDKNAILIAWISGIIVVIGILTGSISIGRMIAKSKGAFT